MVTFPSVAWLSLFGACLPLRPPQSIRNVCFCLDLNYEHSSSSFPWGSWAHTSKRMQLDPYLSVHKHSMTVTLNSLVHIDDLWTGGRLVPHASISESQPERIAIYNSGIHEVTVHDRKRTDPGARRFGVLLVPLTHCFSALESQLPHL